MPKGEELFTIFYKGQKSLIELNQELNKGSQLAKSLIDENLSLKLQVENLQVELAKKNDDSESPLLGEENRLLQEKVKRLERLNSSIEAEKRTFIQRYIDVEKQNEALANLYVASYQLHSTLDSQKVVNTISEIIVNLIGAEEFAIFTVDEDHRELIFMGGDINPTIQRNKKKILLGTDIEGQVALSRKPYRSLEGEHLISIPLEISVAAKGESQAVNELIGVISIYKLLAHKKTFTDLDYDLLNLLAGHAATALLSAKLYQGTERKLRTIEGFMNLLRNS